MPRVISYYTADSTDTYRIRLDSAYLVTPTVQKTAPAASSSTSITLRVSGSRNRSVGIHPRGVRLFRTVGTSPNFLKRWKFLPILNPGDYSDPIYDPGATVTISSVAWIVDKRIPETIR